MAIIRYPQRFGLFSPGKVNFCLHIVKQRTDGYHELQSAIALLNWGDQLFFDFHRNSSPPGLTLAGFADLATSDNIIYKAFQSFQRALGHAVAPCHIEVKKQIPMGAGLGGGSSNAATCLLGLNQALNYPLSDQELLKIGQTLGADVPVFLSQRHSWVEGIGEQLRPIQLPSCFIVLVFIPLHSCTKTLFSDPKLERQHHRLTAPIPGEMWDDQVKVNHFEALARLRSPAIETAFQRLQAFGQPRLSGSGSTIFLVYPDQHTAEQQQQRIQALQYVTTCCALLPY